MLQGVGFAIAIIYFFFHCQSVICSVQGHVHVLLQYHKCAVSEDYFTMDSASDSSSKESPHFSDNHYCKALEHAIDTDLDWSILKKIVPM